ncbi:MAG TPA: cytidylate kinase-like family protein [Pirellulales bacterium]|nr:cytidylate kinase-like family protein [Pirellulales bacterium]
MAIKTTSELMGEAVLRAREHWRRAHPGEKFEVAPPQKKCASSACTITISRESGAGGAAVAREVGRLLGWPVYDRELLEQIAEQSGLRSELLETLDEKRSHWLVEILEALSGVSTMSGASYARHLAETILALASHGHCVIVGRGSTMIVPPKMSLRVRLVAALNDRTERICKRMGMGKVAAIEHVKSNDAHREGFVKDYFHRNVGDPHDYDLVINTSAFSVEQAARMIVEALREREKGG